MIIAYTILDIVRNVIDNKTVNDPKCCNNVTDK